MDFNRELLARLEAAQLGSPAALHGAASGSHAATAAAAAGSSRRVLWPSELGPPGGSPGSSGRQTPRGCGLLEALYTSDGSPRADQTARAAAAAARAATAPPLPPASAAQHAGCWSELPADIWRWVVAGLTPADVKAARLVCADWHAALSSNVHLLRPRQLRCKLAAQRCACMAGWRRLTGMWCRMRPRPKRRLGGASRVDAELTCSPCCARRPRRPQLPLPASARAEPVPAPAGEALHPPAAPLASGSR